MKKLSIPERDKDNSLTDILEATALQRTALAELINAQAEGVKEVISKDGVDFDPNKILEFQSSVDTLLNTSIEMQKLLRFDLKDVLEDKKIETTEANNEENQEETLEITEEVTEEYIDDKKIVTKTVNKKKK